jgi:hypothetical protein
VVLVLALAKVKLTGVHVSPKSVFWVIKWSKYIWWTFFPPEIFSTYSIFSMNSLRCLLFF